MPLILIQVSPVQSLRRVDWSFDGRPVGSLLVSPQEWEAIKRLIGSGVIEAGSVGIGVELVEE